MNEISNTISRILDMQRRGSKDYDQTARLLESYFYGLSPGDKPKLFQILEDTLRTESFLPADSRNKYSSHGAIIKALARFGRTERLVPIIFSLIDLNERKNIAWWSSSLVPPFNSALTEYAERFSIKELNQIADSCRKIISTGDRATTGKPENKTLVAAVHLIESTLKHIDDKQLETGIRSRTNVKDISVGLQKKDRQYETRKSGLLLTKEDYFAVSSSEGLPKRCPILGRCERRAETIGIFNNWDLKNAPKLAELETPTIASRGDSPHIISGSNNYVCGGLCPEVCLFEPTVTMSMFQGIPATSGRYDKYMTPASEILTTGHYTECAEYSAYLDESDTIGTNSKGRSNIETGKQSMKSNKVFVVHGHDEAAKLATARFLERLGLEPVILHEMASGGNTIIEKVELHSNVGFAVVLLTPDDVGAPKSTPKALKARARQNVIFELGYFVGKLERKNVCVLFKGVEIPTDFDGVVRIEMDAAGAWNMLLARELKHAGIDVDLNRAL